MKLQSIQILRGIAAWMIVFYHFIKHFHYPTENTGLFSFFGQLGIDMFFVISGFIMAFILSTNHRTTKDFILNRIIRIVPNYWFWTLIMMIVGYLISDGHVLNTTFSSFFLSIFFITHDHPSAFLGYYPLLSVGWTLNMEMFFYVLISLVLLFGMTARKTLFMTGFILFCFVAIYKIFHIELYKEVAGNARLLEFMFGIILHYLWKSKLSFFRSKYYLIFLFTITCTVCFVAVPDTLKLISVAVLLVYLFLLFDNYLNPENFFIQKLVNLGEMSYSTYLLHIIIILVVHHYLGDIMTLSVFIYALVSTMILVYIFSMLSHKLIEVNISNFLRIHLISKILKK